MTADNAVRQWRSAGHYLTDANLTERLQPTLVLAARTLGFPVGMVNILDEHNRHTIALVGEGPFVTSPRPETLCDTVVRTDQPLVVVDARDDERFAGLPPVSDGSTRSYIGVPLRGRESLPIGALCVIDPNRRAVDADQLARLAQFGKVLEDQLDLIRRLDEQRQVGDVATAALAEAIVTGGIVPWYQPIVELTTNRLIGFEALARWEHPSGEVEHPNAFIPLAEDSDLIIDLDLCVMRQALVDLKRWQRSESALRMSVNLSSRHFDHADWLAPILAMTQAIGVSPRDVSLELTETVRLSTGNIDGVFVQQLREQGFQVWLDDFGTGWSSLEYLLRLGADGLKIDRAISVALGSHIGDALVRSVTDLARQLQMMTTIEGVESTEIAARAAALGCDHAQGYLWSEAVPAAVVDARHNAGLMGSDLRLWIPAAAVGTSEAPGESPAAGVGNCSVATPVADPVCAVSEQTRQPVDRSAGDALAAAVLDAIPDATAVLDLAGEIVAVNHSWRMFSVDNGGSDATNGVGVNYLDVCTRAGEHGSADARQVATDLRAVLTGTFVESEWEYPCPSPTQRRWFMLRITRLTGPTPGAIASHVNITRRKMAEDELGHAASHDPLTGLANRALLQLQLTKALTVRRDRHRAADVGVLFIDLDGFKAINDTFGHGAGDDLLLEVAHRLRSVARPGSTIARLGGDEFVVLSPRTTMAGLTALAARVETALAEPHHLHGRVLSVGGSVGMHLATAGEDAADALRQADEAMYVVKRAGKLPL